MSNSKKKGRNNAPLSRAQQDAPLGRRGRDALRILSLDRPVPLGPEKATQRLERRIAEETREEADEYYTQPEDLTPAQDFSEESLILDESEPSAFELRESLPLEVRSRLASFDAPEIASFIENGGWQPAVVDLYVLTRDNLTLDEKTKAQLFSPEVKARDIYDAVKFGIHEGWAQLRSKEF